MPNTQLTGVGLAVVTSGMNLRMVIGPVLFGTFVERAGYLHGEQKQRAKEVERTIKL